MPDALDVLEAWEIDVESISKLTERYALTVANTVQPSGPLTPYSALFTTFLSGFEFGYMARNELEMQKEVEG